MVSKATVDDFVKQEKLAVVGVSRSGRRYGAIAYKELKKKGYQLYPVHPEAETIGGDPAYKSLADLPEEVGGVLVMVPPSQASTVVKQAGQAGIPRVWLQQGAASAEAIKHCQDNDISVVHDHCILMFATPEHIHKFHGWCKKLVGSYPR